MDIPFPGQAPLSSKIVCVIASAVGDKNQSSFQVTFTEVDGAATVPGGLCDQAAASCGELGVPSPPPWDTDVVVTHHCFPMQVLLLWLFMQDS